MSWPPPRNTRKARSVEEAFGPPITDEESNGNLSLLENQLNRNMKCVAGRNQVYLRSLLTGHGTTQPRIALTCHLRKDAGEEPEEELGLTEEQQKELDRLIAEVDEELKKESETAGEDPLGIARTWEERYGRNRTKG